MSADKASIEAFKEKTFVQKRLLLSCNMCKKHKIKCDKEMPQCQSCFKKGVPCLSVCPSTQREVPRSYLLYLEDLLCVYAKKLGEYGIDCDKLKSNFPTNSEDPPVNVDVYRERFTEANEVFNSEDRYIKRVAKVDSDPDDAKQIILDNDDSNGKRAFEETNKENNSSSIIKEPKKIRKNNEGGQFIVESVALTPSNSNISKSNILESFQSTTSMNKSGSIIHSNLTEISTKPHNQKEHDLLSTNITSIVSEIRADPSSTERINNNEIKTYLGDSSGIPFAKLMLTAINFQNEPDNTDYEEDEVFKNSMHTNAKDDPLQPVEIPIVEDNVNSLYLPSFNEAEKLIRTFFNRMNPQYPIFDFSMFHKLYFMPLYGDDQKLRCYIKPKKQTSNSQNNVENEEDSENSISPLDTDQNVKFAEEFYERNDQQKVNDSKLPICFTLHLEKSYCHFIETLKSKYPNSSLHYLLEDEKYKGKVIPLKLLLDTASNNFLDKNFFESELPAVYKKALFFTNMVMSLGSCSEVLLNGTMHCITLKKRAMKWMKAVLNDESSESFEEHVSRSVIDESVILQQIRLQFGKLESLSGLLLLTSFSMCVPSIPTVWYSIGIPLRLIIDLGLHNEKYNNELLASVLANSTPCLTDELKSSAEFLIDLRRRLFWTTYSMDRQLALYFGRPVSLPDESISLFMISYKPPRSMKYDSFSIHTRIITVAMIEIRKLQSELLGVMYAPKSQLPREFDTLDSWKKNFDKKLNKWYSERVPKKLHVIGYMQFKREFFRINLYHTKTMLNGISPRCDITHSDDELEKLYSSTKKMIYQYYRLWISKSLNYTWIACHNLFMCSMTFLYTRYKKNDIESLDETCADVLTIIKALMGTCEAAPNCYKSIKVLARAVKKLIISNKNRRPKASDDSPVSITMSTAESVETDPELQLFFDKLLNDNDVAVDQPLVSKVSTTNDNSGDSKPDISDEVESIWGLDDEYKSRATQLETANSNLSNKNIGEEQRIYDMLYTHVNKPNIGDWVSYMLSPQNVENDRSNSTNGLKNLTKDLDKTDGEL